MDLDQVFISYAREDILYADRLYMDLRHAEINAWMDSKCLLPGQNWKKEIPKAIRNSTFFIALISKNSLNKRGFVQKELKSALEVLEEIPSNQIFFIPVRLDDSVPHDEELLNLNWVDLHISYPRGLRSILTALSTLKRKPLEYLSPEKTNSFQEKGSFPFYTTTDPLIGSRQPINYAPFRKFSDYIRDFVEKLPKSTIYSDANYQYFFTILTQSEGVKLPQFLIDKYPTQIILVFQNQYRNLSVENDFFTVDLWFDKKAYSICITYESVIQIAVPNIGLNLEKVG